MGTIILFNNDAQKIRESMDNINEYWNEKKPINTIAISNDGAVGHEEMVRKDYVVSSYILMEVIKSEINKLNQLQECIEKLCARIY